LKVVEYLIALNIPSLCGKDEHWCFAVYAGVRSFGARGSASGSAQRIPWSHRLHESVL